MDNVIDYELRKYIFYHRITELEKELTVLLDTVRADENSLFIAPNIAPEIKEKIKQHYIEVFERVPTGI
jgi:hypothetical protein